MERFCSYFLISPSDKLAKVLHGDYTIHWSLFPIPNEFSNFNFFLIKESSSDFVDVCNIRLSLIHLFFLFVLTCERLLNVFFFFFDRQCSPAGVLLTTLVAISYKIALLFEGYVRLSVDTNLTVNWWCNSTSRLPICI